MWTSNGLRYLAEVTALNYADNTNARTYTTTQNTTTYVTSFTLSNTKNITSYITNETTVGGGYGNFRLLIGSDDTPTSLSDYKLGACFESLTVDYERYTNDANGNFITTKVFTNSTSEDIIAKEIGLYVGSPSSPYYMILLAREVFDTPITIKSGESKLFSFQLDFTKLN